MHIHFERHGGNEIFRADIVEESLLWEGVAVALEQVQVPHKIVARPCRSQTFELDYWRHFGPTALELKLRVGIRPTSESNRIHWAGEAVLELIPFVQEALNGTVSWPFWNTEVTIRVEKHDLFRVDQHRDSILLLFQLALSNVETERFRPPAG